jgi:hypothetical protein
MDSDNWTIPEIKNLIELYKYYKVPIFEIVIILNRRILPVVQKLFELKLIKREDFLLILSKEVKTDSFKVLKKVRDDLNRRILLLEKK